MTVPAISYVPSNRVLRIVWSTAAVVFVALLVGLSVAVIGQSAQLDRAAVVDEESKADRAALHDAVRAQQDALDEANTRLVDAGESPVATPSTVPEALAGPTGARGPSGPSGPAGEDGADGASGRPGAVGPSGPAGATGTGAPGAAGQEGAAGDTGPQGPAGDRGPSGEPGPAGLAGADGAPGPAGADGASAFPFSFTFTVPGALPGTATTYAVTCVVDGCSVVES